MPQPAFYIPSTQLAKEFTQAHMYTHANSHSYPPTHHTQFIICSDSLMPRSTHYKSHIHTIIHILIATIYICTQILPPLPQTTHGPSIYTQMYNSDIYSYLPANVHSYSLTPITDTHIYTNSYVYMYIYILTRIHTYHVLMPTLSSK